ncbi:PREDICTED: uncharacterized protein LOC106308377 [Brassica oleracea var. oleracea]|uniref:uncharacterized protein LOC106308377 n=1 Tax=Brassica oleracea var. oleracea TaxID=109376 RepID=UPI0006A73E0D|nr:PREDICTED: uncharacterized protein LOC106308377 [Brassica oleracea var. oleracea]
MEGYLAPAGLASQFIKAKLGNGEKIRFRSDNWTPYGSLLTYFGERGPSQLQIPIFATVSDTCTSSGWIMRGARSNEAEELQTYLTTIENPRLSSVEDCYVWSLQGEEFNTFQIKIAWEGIRNRGQIQAWTRNVWFSGAVPRHAFTFWVASQDRLPTRARLASWSMNTPTTCCLCDSFIENRDHLFLRCEVSEQIWERILTRLGHSGLHFHTWTAFSDWISIRDTTSSRTLKRLALQTVIYNIWRERNNRLHASTSSTSAIVCKQIDRFIRDVILGHWKNKRFNSLMQSWLRFE